MPVSDQDLSEHLQARVADAVRARAPLRLHGGDSKAFYGRAVDGTACDLSGHRGIIHYEPTELVLTARAGTPLREIESALAEHDQMLAFEPPHFGAAATLGGTIACNLSGPRRPHAGAARDFVLGTRIINGRAEILSFGGEVMKNVAGYDVSRLMTGALGTLGVVLDVSLKVLPRPETELTLVRSGTPQQALDRVHELGRLPLPVSATCYDGNALYLRLSGSARGVAAARDQIGGDQLAPEAEPWFGLREHQHPFFSDSRPLWRLSLASTAPPLALDGAWLYEWGGAQRWLLSAGDPGEIRRLAQYHGGHATHYRGDPQRAEFFQPPSRPLLELQRRLKQAFDPHGVLNPGRMYRGV